MNQSILGHAMPSWLSHPGPDNDVVISTRIRLARNCTGHRFPLHASAEERTGVFREVVDAFNRSCLRDSFDCINFSQLDKREQLFMVEECLACRDLAAADGDRGVMHDGSRRISVMVNADDHLKLQCIDAGCRPHDLWAEVDGIDDAVGMQLDYAFDNRRGFLTSRPSDAGTGLRVSFLMNLPALVLTREIGHVLDQANRMGMVARGFFGGQLSAKSGMCLLANGAALGIGESGICDRALAAARLVMDHERKARESLLAIARGVLGERIFGSYGVLCSAARLGMEEFLNMTSVLRLGIECTLFDKCTIDDLNRLTLFAMPAHLQACLKKDISEKDVGAARAGFVKSFFGKENPL